MVFSAVTAPNYKYALQAAASNCVCVTHAAKRLIWLQFCWHVCLTGSLKGQLNQKSTGCVILDKVNLLMPWRLFIYLLLYSFRMVFNGGRGSLTWLWVFASWRAVMSPPDSCQNQAGERVKPFPCQKSPLMPILALLSRLKCPRGSAKRGGITSAWLLKLFKCSFLVPSQLKGS